jgi:hypothetical protein
MKTLMGEIWDPARQRFRLCKSLKKIYLRDAEVCERPESGMLTVVIMVSPTGEFLEHRFRPTERL